MKTYSITVEEIRNTLNEMIEQGHAKTPFVISQGMVGGAMVNPITGIGVAPIALTGGGRAILVEEGPDESAVAYIETPPFVACDFWENELK